MQEKFHKMQESEKNDSIEMTLRGVAEYVLVGVFGLLPLMFIPLVYAPFEYSKTFIVIVGIFISCIFFSLSILRSGSIKITAPWALLSFWAVALTSVISAALSGDMRDSFIGESLEVHTAVFAVLLATVMTLWAVLGRSKSSIMRLYILLTGSAIFLGSFHILRVLLGTDFLSFGIFTSFSSSPLGGWNDVGLFFGLTILLSLVALEQLPLTKWGRILFSVVVAVSLAMLAIVNFFAIWIVLALVSLIQLMYVLTKDRFAEKTIPMQGVPHTPIYSIILSSTVFLLSILFIVGGSAVGGMVSNVTGISHLEVRPSLSATIEIGRQVYQENAFTGIGANKFTDAWRLYKDQSINQTIFWSTDFASGSGFVITEFVTGGIIAVVAWLVFFMMFISSGFKMLFKAVHVDRFWYFIGTSSFVAALYLWSMAIVYSPGPVMLMLTALFTSIVFVARGALIGDAQRRLSITANKRAAFVLVAVVMLVIVGSTSVLYYSGRHYTSVYAYNTTINDTSDSNSIEESETAILAAYSVTKNDSYLRQIVAYQLNKMGVLMDVAEPSQQQQQVFQTAVSNGINTAQLAIQNDPDDSLNWSAIGAIYSLLAGAGLDDAEERAVESFAKARSLDPSNPIHYLFEAQLHFRTQKLESARSSVMKAIELKSNYAEALFFLTQLDISEGKVDDAIATTKSIISLEPRNPIRFYQLGVLESSNENNKGAIEAFSQAIKIDSNYSNARYLLALTLVKEGNTDDALFHLEEVLRLNPDNTKVKNVIESIQSGDVSDVGIENAPETILEPENISEEAGEVTASEDPQTPLLSTDNPAQDTNLIDSETTE